VAPYRSPLREARAARTRHRVLDAAETLFLRNGYVATPVTAIADAAGVSPETIYKSFGTKAAVLQGVVVRAVTGADLDADEVLERPLDWVEAALEIEDPRARLEATARAGRAIYQRTASLQRVLSEAAAADPAIADQLRANQARRLADLQRVVESLDADGVLPTTMKDATDVVWAVASPYVYEQLTQARSWTPDHYEVWLAGFLTRELIASSTDPRHDR
jgi:AcrR family transcriptional regulator